MRSTFLSWGISMMYPNLLLLLLLREEIIETAQHRPFQVSFSLSFYVHTWLSRNNTHYIRPGHTKERQILFIATKQKRLLN
jgi:hypothetical protein